MRAVIAGPLTAVGGFHRKAAVFKPSIPVVEVPKLLGKGTGVNSAATAVSSGLPRVLFVADRVS